MDSQAQIILRAKKLGTLIRDARLATRRSVKECAETIKVTAGVFKAYEEDANRHPCLSWKRWFITSICPSIISGATKRFLITLLELTN